MANKKQVEKVVERVISVSFDPEKVYKFALELLEPKGNIQIVHTLRAKDPKELYAKLVKTVENTLLKDASEDEKKKAAKIASNIIKKIQLSQVKPAYKQEIQKYRDTLQVDVAKTLITGIVLVIVGIALTKKFAETFNPITAVKKLVQQGQKLKAAILAIILLFGIGLIVLASYRYYKKYKAKKEAKEKLPEIAKEIAKDLLFQKENKTIKTDFEIKLDNE